MVEIQSWKLYTYSAIIVPFPVFSIAYNILHIYLSQQILQKTIKHINIFYAATSTAQERVQLDKCF